MRFKQRANSLQTISVFYQYEVEAWQSGNKRERERKAVRKPQTRECVLSLWRHGIQGPLPIMSKLRETLELYTVQQCIYY